MILCRPVKKRAILIAFSLASAPPFVKKNVSISPGVISASFAPNSARGSCAHKGIGICEGLRLLADGIDDALIAMANVHRHQLAVEVDKPLPVRRPEVNAFGLHNGNRVYLRLRRPFVQRMFLTQIDNCLSGNGRWYGCDRHRSLSFSDRFCRWRFWGADATA